MINLTHVLLLGMAIGATLATIAGFFVYWSNRPEPPPRWYNPKR